MRNRYCMISMLMGLLSMNLALAQSDCLDELDCESSWLQPAGVFESGVAVGHRDRTLSTINHVVF